MLCRIIGRSLDADDVILKVDVFPFKTEHLTSAKSAVCDKEEESSVLRILSVDSNQELCHFLLLVGRLLIDFTFGNCHFSARIADHLNPPFAIK